MVITPISDVSTRTLQAALSGVDQSRQAHQDNIANMETPGYLARTVSFQDSLAEAVKDGTPEAAQSSFTRSTSPTNMNGNNVGVDQEMVGLTKDQLNQQLLTEALNAKYRLLRTAMG